MKTTSDLTPVLWGDTTSTAEAKSIRVVEAIPIKVNTEKFLSGEYVVAKFYGPDREANAVLCIRAVNNHAELLAFAKWAIHQFQGDSGTGDSHWNQYREYRAGLNAIAKAEGRA